MAKGGYRKPTKPAAVSGPGKFARRTDGGASQPVRDMTGGGYGEATEMRNLQSSAPMAASGRTPSPPQAMPAASHNPSIHDVPFGAPTNNPEEPVTAGVPVGPGPGPEVLPQQQSGSSLEHLRPYLPVLNYMANQPDSSSELRNFVRTVRGVLG